MGSLGLWTFHRGHLASGQNVNLQQCHRSQDTPASLHLSEEPVGGAYKGREG